MYDFFYYESRTELLEKSELQHKTCQIGSAAWMPVTYVSVLDIHFEARVTLPPDQIPETSLDHLIKDTPVAFISYTSCELEPKP
jgi:hypothetical protein